MKRKSREGYKSKKVRDGNVGGERPEAARTTRHAFAPDATAGPGQEDTLAGALQNFRLDRHSSYTAQVEDALRAAIVRGRLPPGTALSEAAISTTLGISRTPAREALALLADEQLVLIYPQVKTVVAPVRRSLIDEGRFVRSTLECANHAELVRTITQQQLDSLAALVAVQRKVATTGDVEAFFKLDEEMHRSLFEFAGRAHVWTMLQGVKRHFDRVRWLLLERVAYHARRAQQEHEAIMDRLLARDVAGLTEAVSHHINAITGHLKELHDRAPESYFVD
jgi:GntR family transcriptional regulator, rspAB operon transcriptional repressor